MRDTANHPYNSASVTVSVDITRRSAADAAVADCEFESRQERQEIFLFQSQLCVLTLIQCSFHPRVTAMARKRPPVILPKVQMAGYT